MVLQAFSHAAFILCYVLLQHHLWRGVPSVLSMWPETKDWERSSDSWEVTEPIRKRLSWLLVPVFSCFSALDSCKSGGNRVWGLEEIRSKQLSELGRTNSNALTSTLWKRRIGLSAGIKHLFFAKNGSKHSTHGFYLRTGSNNIKRVVLVYYLDPRLVLFKTLCVHMVLSQLWLPCDLQRSMKRQRWFFQARLSQLRALKEVLKRLYSQCLSF